VPGIEPLTGQSQDLVPNQLKDHLVAVTPPFFTSWAFLKKNDPNQLLLFFYCIGGSETLELQNPFDAFEMILQQSSSFSNQLQSGTLKEVEETLALALAQVKLLSSFFTFLIEI